MLFLKKSEILIPKFDFLKSFLIMWSKFRVANFHYLMKSRTFSRRVLSFETIEAKQNRS